MADRLSGRVKTWLETGGKRLTRFKYPILLLLLGLLLVLLPFGRRSSGAGETNSSAETVPAEPQPVGEEAFLARTERQLAEILSQIDGAGSVRVMLTLRSGTTVEYQTDLESSTQKTEAGESAQSRRTTVIFTRGSAYDEAAVVKTEYPVFQGALIVSKGADDAGVCLALKNAVSSLLGLGTDKITVVKMK